MDKRDFLVYVPTGNKVFHIMEGTGDNLLEEDIAEGFVDYINYDMYELTMFDGFPVLQEVDGGMCLLEKMYMEFDIKELAERAVGMEYVVKTPYHIVWQEES